MGLDHLEITHQIESTLGVELSQDDFWGLIRDRDIAVGDLYELLLQKMQLRDVARHDIGLNYSLWREIQHVLGFVTIVPPKQIELKTPLAELFPRETRRTAWDALREACPYRVRELDYPQTVRVVGVLLAISIVLIEQFQIWQLPGAQWFWPLLGLIGIGMVAETYAKILSICAPLRNRFPTGMTTVKDLCRAVLARNYAEVCQNVEVALDHRSLVVWQQLTDILVDVLGVDADQITFRSRLIRDLGMG